MIINLAMFAAMVLTSVSGIVLRVIAPLKKSSGVWREFAEWVFQCSRRTWKDIHTWAGIAVVVLLAMHLIFHWGVIDGFCKRHIPNAVARWTLYVVLMALLLISVIPWVFAF
ncbi:MAG: DUF4405 domain-containing protein [Alistipes sp.]|nr:DUF4405 domain-containing protein [Alistipes sp.]